MPEPHEIHYDEAGDSTTIWSGLIKDVKACSDQLKLQQLITRHIRDPIMEEELRDVIRGVFFHSSKKVVYCDVCGFEHYRLALSDKTAKLALDEFYYQIQVSFSAWMNEQSGRLQQGLHSAADSVSMIPPIGLIMKERHKGARIE